MPRMLVLMPPSMGLFLRMFVGKRVKQWDAGCEEIRDQRQHHEQRASAPQPAFGGDAHTTKLHRRTKACQTEWISLRQAVGPPSCSIKHATRSQTHHVRRDVVHRTLGSVKLTYNTQKGPTNCRARCMGAEGFEPHAYRRG
jgi:hypothetical protein